MDIPALGGRLVIEFEAVPGARFTFKSRKWPTQPDIHGPFTGIPGFFVAARVQRGALADHQAVCARFIRRTRVSVVHGVFRLACITKRQAVGRWPEKRAAGSFRTAARVGDADQVLAGLEHQVLVYRRGQPVACAHLHQPPGGSHIGAVVGILDTHDLGDGQCAGDSVQFKSPQLARVIIRHGPHEPVLVAFDHRTVEGDLAGNRVGLSRRVIGLGFVKARFGKNAADREHQYQ